MSSADNISGTDGHHQSKGGILVRGVTKEIIVLEIASFIVFDRSSLNDYFSRYIWELWTLRMQRKQLYRQIMDSQARKVAKQHHFNRWRLVARRQKDAATKAGLILRHLYLKMVFRAWRNHIIRERDLR